MTSFNLPETIHANGHKPVESNRILLAENSTTAPPQNPQDSLTENIDVATEDWSFATKELLDALPQRWTRGLLYFIVFFVAVALPWSMLSKVDETGVSRGKLEPQKGTLKQEVDFSETVKTVYVEAGDRVKRGDPLIEFDTWQVQDQLQQKTIQLEGYKNRLTQLEKQQHQLEIERTTQQRQNQSQQLEKSSQVEQVRRNIESLKTVYTLQQEEKLAQVNQAQQNLDALRRSSNLQQEEKRAQVSQARQHLEDSKTAYKLTEIRWKKAQREVERYRQLWQQGVVTEVQVLEKEDISEERQGLLEQAQANIEQAQLRLEEEQGSYERIIHQTTSDIEQAQLRLEEEQGSYERIIHQVASDIEQAQLRLSEQENSSQTILHSGEISLSNIQEDLKNIELQKATLQAEIAQIQKEIESLKFDLDKRIIKATASGIIFNLPIKTPGEVVQQGEMVVEIAPENSVMLLRSQMATTESGSLRENMPVKIKFDAYPFQDYGIIEGRLKKISPTSEEQETPQGTVATYELEIELNQTCIPTATECIVLRPGDTATAEVIVRQRRVIDFILDPFKKLQQGGLEL